MKRVLILVAILAISVARLGAQPIHSTAFDPKCYQPRPGENPSQLDTIYGSTSGEYMGDVLVNLGPKPGGGYGNMLLSGLSPSVALAQVETGRNFNLHNLKEHLQTMSPGSLSTMKLGHLRNSTSVDILIKAFDGPWWRIYWADNDGSYDVQRYTELETSLRGDNLIDNRVFDSYIARLSSDTVDDIVVGFTTLHTADDTKDTIYLGFFRGGAQLAIKSTAYEDTSTVLLPAPIHNDGQEVHYCTQADFRGTGRQDLVIADGNNDLFFFRNDPPFQLDRLAKAMLYDTLWSRFEQPHLKSPTLQNIFTMRALSKPTWDKSVDLLPVLNTDDDRNSGIFIFRGGLNFGSHRLTLDSAAYVIRHPGNLDYTTFGIDYYWPQTLVDAGDMTGTGNRVLYTTARNGVGDGWADAFYLTGKALDEKIDVYNPFMGGSGADTLTANSDGLQDLLVSRPGYFTDDDRNRGKMWVGTLWLYYGSREIPVTLNPKWAAVTSEHPTTGPELSLFPNPAHSWSALTISWPKAEGVEYAIRDLLGRSVQQGSLRLIDGEQEVRVDFALLPSGIYYIIVQGSTQSAKAKLVIAH